tara:strand:- start:6414 stop:7775 length:1362 start_codon:yes stop_codon:yes gene_type:complete
MGIFGFLSKAHIEQTSASEETVANVQRIESEIERLETIITRAEEKIVKAENSVTSNDDNIQAQIDKEQERIDGAYARQQPAIDEQNLVIEKELSRVNEAYDRVQPAIDEQNAIIEKEEQKLKELLAPYENELKAIDEKLVAAETWQTEGKVKELQALIGVTADGNFGYRSRSALKRFKEEQEAKRLEVLEKISTIKEEKENNPTIIAAREEIKRLRGLAEQEVTNTADNPIITTAREEIKRLRGIAEEEIKNSNELISRLRSQLGQDTDIDVEEIIDEQNNKIRKANDEIDVLIDEKFALEKEFRQLEAEVGPIKYIAEFVYGDKADQNLLEQAVRWVIIIIVVVFDPLAIMLVLAGVQTIEWGSGRTRPKIKKQPVDNTAGDKEKELEMKIQEHTDLLLRLEEELDKAKASENMSKSELGKLQTAYDDMVEEKTGLEEELSNLQKKRPKLTT